MKPAGVVCAAAVLCAAGAAHANRSGIVGRAQSGCGGGGCHSGGASPTVELIGPSTAAPGAVLDFTLRVSGGQSAAGVDIEASAGLLVPGAGLTARAGELVHAGNTVAYVDGAAAFTFRLEVPDSPGVVELFAAGNSVDDNFLPAGDGWALATATVTVGDGAVVDPDLGMADAGPSREDDTDDTEGCAQRPGRSSGGALAALVIVGGLLVRRRATQS